jgi:P-type Mg2+ transporter
VSSAPERVEPSAELPAHPGLSSEEAHRRLAEHGPNLLATDHRRRLAVEFLARFRNPLVLLLLAASAVSALTGDVASFAIVTIIVCMSVTLDSCRSTAPGGPRSA